jgi:hypothetical protein
MKWKYLSEQDWGWLLFLSAGLFSFLLYRYDHQIGIQGAKLYDILQDPHRLKAFICSFGPYSPLAFILLQVLQVVIAPIPGGAIEFLGGYLSGVKAGLIYSMIGLLKVVQRLGGDEGYTLILEKNENIVLFASKSIDLTDRVIKAYDAQMK